MPKTGSQAQQGSIHRNHKLSAADIFVNKYAFANIVTEEN